MNDHVDPIFKAILDDFTNYGKVEHVRVMPCSQNHCKKTAPCIQFKSVGWICEECEDKLNELIEGRKK